MRQQVLYFVQRQATIDQLSRSAHRHVVPRFGLRRQGWDLRGVPGQTGVVKTGSGDVTVGKTLFLTSASSHPDDNDLLIAHTLGGLQTVNPDVAEVRCENLTTFGQTFARDNEYQYATGFQPAIGMAQEQLLGAATVGRPQSPVIGWIQIKEANALDRALHFQRISLDDVGNLLPGLF